MSDIHYGLIFVLLSNKINLNSNHNLQKLNPYTQIALLPGAATSLLQAVTNYGCVKDYSMNSKSYVSKLSKDQHTHQAFPMVSMTVSTAASLLNTVF